MAPRTVKEVVAAKRARLAERRDRLAQHARDDSNRRAEEKRKAEAGEARKRHFSELHDMLEDTERLLQSGDISEAEHQALSEERARLRKYIQNARI